MATTDLPAPEPLTTTADGPVASGAARAVLAALSAGAGAIHLAMVAPHAQDSTLDGLLFAAAGWTQLALALVLVARPSRAALAATVGVHLATLTAWAVSRTAGLPWGAHAGTAEDVASLDLLCAALEAAAVVVAAAVLVRPGLGAGIRGRSLALTAGVPALAVIALTTASLASEDGVHGHDGGGHDHQALATGDGHAHDDDLAHGEVPAGCADHDHTADHAAMDDTEMAAWAAVHAICSPAGHDDHHGDGAAQTVGWDERCDAEFNIASYWREAELIGANTADPHHTHSDETMDHHANGMHEQEAARLVQDLAEMSDEEYEEWLRNLNPATRDPNAPDDTGAGGHMGAQPWIPITDQATCDTVRDELDLAYETAMKYPTVADAKAAGYFMVAPYVPGIASHWMNFRYVDGRFDIEEPEMLLFDGNADHAQIVGLSYYLLDPGEEQPTEGFTGDNDLYHRHVGLCMKNGVVIADTSTTDEECAAMGGYKADGQAGWMSHAWVVPGCESPWGVFSAANPVLDSQLIQNQGQGEPCSGSAVADRYDRTPGPPTDS